MGCCPVPPPIKHSHGSSVGPSIAKLADFASFRLVRPEGQIIEI